MCDNCSQSLAAMGNDWCWMILCCFWWLLAADALHSCRGRMARMLLETCVSVICFASCTLGLARKCLQLAWQEYHLRGCTDFALFVHLDPDFLHHVTTVFFFWADVVHRHAPWMQLGCSVRLSYCFPCWVLASDFPDSRAFPCNPRTL